MNVFKRAWKQIRGIFAPDVMIGGNVPPPLNRKQRRIQAALVRKQLSKQKGEKK